MMKKRFNLLLLSFLLSLGVSIYSVDFQFTYEEGQNYRIVTEVNQNVKQNDRLLYTTKILNRIAVSIIDEQMGSGDIEAIYQISERDQNSGYRWNSEELVRFSRDKRGEYFNLPDDSALPAVRNLPRFPEEDIQPGDQWNFMAEEVHDFLPTFGIDYRLKIPFRAFYRYEGTVEEEGKILDKILINYNIYYEEDPIVTYYEHPEWGDLFPEKIVSSFYQEYFWDREAGRPARVEDRFEIKYYLTDGVSYTFSGISYGEVIFAEEMNREEMAEEISRELAEEGVEDIVVTPEEEGVRITMEDIRFQPNSPILEESEIPKLERISEILLRYRDRDILITGHTARFGTEESSQILSEERAATVAAYLLEMKIREESEIVTRGFGSRRPIGDNSSIEGQKLNRRVEITILEN